MVCFCLILAQKMCLIPSRTNELGILAHKTSVPPYREKRDLVEAPTRGGHRGRTEAPGCCTCTSDCVRRWGGSTEPPCRSGLVGGDAQGDDGAGLCDGSCTSCVLLSAIPSLAAGAIGAPCTPVAVRVHPEGTYKDRGGQKLHEINPIR